MTTQKTPLPNEAEGRDNHAENSSFVGDSGGSKLVDFLQVARVRRKIIILTTIIVMVVTTAVVMQLTPRYTATAVVMLDQRKNSVEDVSAVLSGLPSDQSTVQNQVQILTSVELAQRVVKTLKLDKDPEFNPHAVGLGAIASYLNPFNWFPGRANVEAAAHRVDPLTIALAHKIINNLTVTPIGISTAISVSYVSTSATKASQIANAVADAYVEDQLEAKFEATRRATQWLTGRIQELSRQSQEADSAVQRYKAEHDIQEVGSGGSIISQQTAGVNSQLVAAKADLAEKQANYSTIVALQKTGQAANSALVQSSPLISALRGQETELNRQLADMSSRYLPSHPKILNLQAQRENLEQRITEEIQRVVESIRNNVSAASAHVSSLQGSLSSLEAQGSGQSKSAVALTSLQSQATSARSMYEAFLGRLNQAQGQEGIQAPDARIITNADVPTSPSFPKTGLLIGISFPAGLMLGLILAFAAERLDSGFRTSAHVEAMLGLPVIAVIPEVPASPDAPTPTADLIITKPMSAFAEAVRGLHLGLVLAHIDREPKVVVVTSSVPGEGKTTVAVSLARAAARGGRKTLLIDADLRRPSVAKTMGLEKASAGLIEALTEKLPLDQCLIKDPKSDVLVLPCLKAPPNPADLLMSQAMRNLLENLGKAFDLIIFDSAPILPVNDAKIVSRLADSVLFVARWEKTPRDAIINALRSLADVEAPISGIALTRADNERFRYYNYGYQDYEAYGKYYSE